MTDKFAAKLMAAVSVIGLSVGMTAAGADQVKHVGGQSSQIKGQSTQDKWTSDHKHNTGQGSSQIKWEGVQSTQGKHAVPSSELNPQPEPPKPPEKGPK